MKHCRQCLYPETKPNLWFDETGLCSACIAFEERKQIAWEPRAARFVCDFPKNKRVIVACSGGKDSTYIVVKLKELGLNPLAVCAMTDDLSAIGRRNLDNIGRLCDLIEVTPNKELRRKMARYALETVGDISWCEHVLIWSVPYTIAATHGIKDVFYGENPQNEYGAGPRESQRLAGMPPQWEQEFGGMLGLRISDMQEHFPDGDFTLYRKLSLPSCIPERHFLGYYFPWDGSANAIVAQKNGFEWYPELVETSLCRWENLDNHQTGIHDYLRYVKFGYTRATDIACNMIRRGLFTRATALQLVKEIDPFPKTYLGKPIGKILADIDMTMSEFWAIVYRFTNKQLFHIEPERYGERPVPTFEVE